MTQWHIDYKDRGKKFQFMTQWHIDFKTGKENFNSWHNDTLILDIRQRGHDMTQNHIKIKVVEFFNSWHNDTVILEIRQARHDMN